MIRVWRPVRPRSLAQGEKAGIKSLFKNFQPLHHESAVKALKRHHITHCAQGHQIKHLQQVWLFALFEKAELP